jgi:hypothetical protein
MALAPVSMAYRTIFIQPHIVLNNAMACRVFRGIKLGLIRDVDDAAMNSTKVSTIMRFDNLSHRRESSGSKPPGIVHRFESSHVLGEIVEEEAEYTKHKVNPGDDHAGHNQDYRTSEVTLDPT